MSSVDEFTASWRDAEALRLPGALSASYAGQLDDPMLVYWNDDTIGWSSGCAMTAATSCSPSSDRTSSDWPLGDATVRIHRW